MYGYNITYHFLDPIGPDANVLLALLLVVAVGLLFHRFIEVPLTGWLTHKYHLTSIQSAP
ncbi:hypothetical protein [Tunturiibacter gelidiferens]|uniref:hypothetical protein n=1 Tax=Tunturiibacter gelidiferens TaxID=3069689 RepID=UPI003D9BA848